MKGALLCKIDFSFFGSKLHFFHSLKFLPDIGDALWNWKWPVLDKLFAEPTTKTLINRPSIYKYMIYVTFYKSVIDKNEVSY